MGLKIAVLMGGASFERDFSLSSGRTICEALESAGHYVIPMDITSDLVPHLRSIRPDVVYSALHGKHGEDGTIQSVLELLSLPYVGSCATVAKSVYNKSSRAHRLETYRAMTHESTLARVPQGICISKDACKDMGVATALDLVVECAGVAFPLAVKPARGGSAMGVSKVHDTQELARGILHALSFDTDVIVEQWIEGTEVAVSIVGTGDAAYALTPVEIAPKMGLYDTDARLDATAVDYFAPPRSSQLGINGADSVQALEAIKDAALEVYRAYGMRQVGRIDMIWDGMHAYVLEANVSPGMTELSLFPMACKAQGVTLGNVISQFAHECVHGA